MEAVQQWFQQLWAISEPILNFSLIDLGKGPVTPGTVLLGLTVMVLATLVSRALRRSLSRFNKGRYGLSASSAYTLERFVHYVVLIVGSILALSLAGLDFGKLALLASALSVGIGFGLQAIVSNFVSGLIILIERSMKVGDYVTLDSGVAGIVSEIRVRATIINTPDNVDVIVPNSEFINGRLTNWTHNDSYCRHRIPFGVAYGTDKERMKELVLAMTKKMPMTLADTPERQPQLFMTGFGDSSLDFELLVWTGPKYATRPGAVKAAFLWELETLLRENDIVVPFPQRDLHIIASANDAEDKGETKT